VASRYEKVPFTKMSLKKWRYMVKMGLINPTGNFILGTRKAPSEPEKGSSVGDPTAPFSQLSVQNTVADSNDRVIPSHITLLAQQNIKDANSVEGLSAIIGQIEASAKSVSDSTINAALQTDPPTLLPPNEQLIPIPHRPRNFKDGEPPFDSRLLSPKSG